MLKSPTLWILRLLKSVGILLETSEDETPIIFLVFALVIFHKYRPEQRIPSFFSSTRTFRINFLSNLSRCCFRHLHPRLLHNRFLFGTRTAVSLNCPVGTGVLCWSRNTFMDLLFQTLSEVTIAITAIHPMGTCSRGNWNRRYVTFNWGGTGPEGKWIERYVTANSPPWQWQLQGTRMLAKPRLQKKIEVRNSPPSQRLFALILLTERR